MSPTVRSGTNHKPALLSREMPCYKELHFKSYHFYTCIVVIHCVYGVCVNLLKDEEEYLH